MPTMRSRRTHVAAVGLTAALVVGAVASQQRHGRASVLLQSLRGSDRLVTNEFATAHPTDPTAVTSPAWLVTSGSLFVRDGVGYTGAPDRGHVDAQSSTTNSGVFRAVTRHDEPADVAVNLRVRILSMLPPSSPVASEWDGVHVFVRYASDAELYVVSVVRRDGLVAIKRKLPGGDINGGRYLTIASGKRPWMVGQWWRIQVRARTSSDGVRLALIVDDRQVLAGVDRGTDGGFIQDGGRIGVRGDNTEFEFTDVSVVPCTTDIPTDCRP